jgi:hypothetical protein
LYVQVRLALESEPKMRTIWYPTGVTSLGENSPLSPDGLEAIYLGAGAFRIESGPLLYLQRGELTEPAAEELSEIPPPVMMAARTVRWARGAWECLVRGGWRRLETPGEEETPPGLPGGVR